MENQVLNIIYRRRSIKKYRPEQIPDEELLKIIEAGRWAPSGGNNQTNHFIVVQNEKNLNELKQLVQEEFSKMEIADDTYKSVKSAILRSREGHYIFTHNAPTLVIVANLRGYGNAMADCAVALENMMLAATSLKVGSCWINQLKWLADNKVIREYMENLGLAKNEVVFGSLALGYSDIKELTVLERKGNRVIYIK